MTTFTTGRKAEKIAADYLHAQGFTILEQNWHTRYCEIDIVALKQGVIYFAEVKYRRTSNQGSGLDYITAKKLQQMQFAAQFWVSNHNWHGNYQLAAIEVAGRHFEVGELTEI